MAITGVNVAATVGIVGSSWISGGISALTLIAVPGLLSTPIPAQALATQWKCMFETGMATMPKVAIVSLLGYSYLAYDRQAKGQQWIGFVAAAALTVGIIPFTIIFMKPTNDTLLGVASGSIRSLGDDAVKQLVQKWAGLNMTRALLTLTGSLVGIWSLLE